MIRFKSVYTGQEIELKPCPFCGNEEPEFNHIGNEYTKTRKIEVKCGKCRIKRVDAGLKHGFDWLEGVAMKNWNQRFSKGCECDKTPSVIMETCRYCSPQFHIDDLMHHIHELDKMGAELSAGSCVHKGGIIGDDGGSACCPITRTRDGKSDGFSKWDSEATK